MNAPLADQMRPQTIDEVVGQSHILSKNGILYRIAQSGHATNLIFYGPPGTGKTTVARIIAKQAGKKLYKLNGTTASTADFKEIISSLDTFEGMNGVVLYLDEIQYLNKKQQQTLLEFLENGQITLIASTTENPYFYIYNAIISRSTVFEFKPVTPEEIEKALTRGVKILEAQAQEQGFSLTVEDHVLRSIALSCGGDVRKSINTLEVAFLSAPVTDGVKSITAEQLRSISQRAALRYDKSDDVHYDLLSALQKSIRGSDENAALHYLARLLEAGDLISPCRRLLVIASEDIGMAYPMCAVIVKACVDSALQLGLPEARIPLAQAVVTMATAPKSNSSYMAINQAIADVRAGKTGDFPRCLQNKHFDGAEVENKGQFYKYPHDYPDHYVRQQYLPDILQGTVYYHFGQNKTEDAARRYRETLLSNLEKREKGQIN
ncbi:replication-associated recombination protein A [Negativibacillus massiliensis]|uniref:replication-associated recombination protein A n=1 Tax=Negativibacillus massiliensis TaxID=1871035 RepID=UPI002A7F25C3|nr:replication-associated recombination protein A [Negativibacillus massiliensis]MDY4047063.1 replication-associated recombination protein A [Negativibacillus massiliensis]